MGEWEPGQAPAGIHSLILGTDGLLIPCDIDLHELTPLGLWLRAQSLGRGYLRTEKMEEDSMEFIPSLSTPVV